MHNFEFKSWKSLVILIAICVIFLVLVIQAFQYIPEENTNKSAKNTYEEPVDETINNEEDSEITENPSQESEEEQHSKLEEQKNNDGFFNMSYRDRSLDRYTNEERPIEPKIEKTGHNFEYQNMEHANLEPIEPERKREQDQMDKLFEIQRKANEYKWQKDYKNAISEYHKYLKVSDDPYRKLEAYDSLAVLYALTNDYDNAIGCAQQAYKIEASPEREFLLTKLYYKSGDVDTATKNINTILQRDFELR